MRLIQTIGILLLGPACLWLSGCASACCGTHDYCGPVVQSCCDPCDPCGQESCVNIRANAVPVEPGPGVPTLEPIVPEPLPGPNGTAPPSGEYYEGSASRQTAPTPRR